MKQTQMLTSNNNTSTDDNSDDKVSGKVTGNRCFSVLYNDVDDDDGTWYSGNI